MYYMLFHFYGLKDITLLKYLKLIFVSFFYTFENKFLCI